MKKSSDLYSGVFFFFLGIILFLLIPSQIKTPIEDGFNSRFFPRVVVVALIVVSFIQIITFFFSLRKNNQSTQEHDDSVGSTGQGFPTVYEKIRLLKKPILFFSILTVYAILMPLLGFLISSLLTGISLLLLVGGFNWKYVITIVLSAVVVTLVFEQALGIQLPRMWFL